MAKQYMYMAGNHGSVMMQPSLQITVKHTFRMYLIFANFESSIKSRN